MIIIESSVITRRTRQNTDEPKPKPVFNVEQMTVFLQSFQQVASGSSRQSDRRKLLKDFKEQDPPSFDVKLDPAAELWIESVEKKLIFWISSSSNSWSSGEGRFSPYGACHNCGQVGHFRCNCPQLQRQ